MSKTAELYSDVEQMYFDEELRTSEISAITGLSIDTITKIIEQLNHEYHHEASLEPDCDDCDDGYALASIGWGTDEDYGYAEDVM